MLIDLWSLLSIEGKEMSQKVDIEMDSFKNKLCDYRLVDKEPISYTFTHIGDKRVLTEAEGLVNLMIPCDRCLSDVKTKILLSASKEIDLSGSEEEVEDVDEFNYVEGTQFDTEKFVYGEILVNLPMKVLCDENCKGICNRCGTNLNHGNCGCDTTELDPRMAKVLEVFNSFKEV